MAAQRTKIPVAVLTGGRWSKQYFGNKPQTTGFLRVSAAAAEKLLKISGDHGIGEKGAGRSQLTLSLPFFGSKKSRLRALNLILGVARFCLRKEVAAVTWTVSGKTLTVTNVDLELLTCGESLETGTLKRSVLCCQP